MIRTTDEIKIAGKVVGRATHDQYESLIEITNSLSEKVILRMVNKQSKNEAVNRERLRMLKDVRTKGDGQKVTDFLQRKWSKLTSEVERSDFCTALGIERSKMDELTEFNETSSIEDGKE